MKSKFVGNRLVRYLLGIVIVLFLFIAVCSAFYVQRTNIYGELKIYVTQDSVSINDRTDCYGVSVFGRKFSLMRSYGYFSYPKEWYFNHLEISIVGINSITPINILIKDTNDKILLNKNFCCIDNIHISELSNNYTFFDKLFKVNWLSKEKIRIIILIIIFYIASTMLLVFLVYFKKDKLKNLIVVLIVLCFLFYFILFFQVYIQRKLFIWSGFWLIFAIFFAIFLILNVAIKLSFRNKQNLLTLIASVFIGILLAEILLRIFGVNLSGFEKRFGYYESIQYQNRIVNYYVRTENSTYSFQNTEFDFFRKSNSIGLSGEDIKEKKDSNEYLIIALGDSFTEGDGAHADSTWPKFLEQKMPKKDSLSFRFINAGISGSDPVYEYRLLKDKLLVYKPNLVIVAYGCEMEDMLLRGGEERFDKMQTAIKKHWWQPVYAVSFVCRLFVHNLFGYNELLIPKQEIIKAKGKAISDLKKTIIQFRELSKDYKFELLIVFYPVKYETDTGKFIYNSLVLEYANMQGVVCLDLLEYYREIENIDASDSQKYYWEIDGHHNAAGYKKFANGVLWKLKQMGY
ncbi:MAG: GDSL-type esterase/lipase family protein [Bacteroidales bacterium]|nr:GDSL-type esterase/lipase family protein [Bacteroidales bacterium]MDD4216325.1 GDSL-type esterase/lipase family protein [Bacteroidales bacterium]MDY0140874.1 GDSL-type esterase/lipase family protein [Bacteroidales bacterium]